MKIKNEIQQNRLSLPAKQQQFSAMNIVFSKKQNTSLAFRRLNNGDSKPNIYLATLPAVWHPPINASLKTLPGCFYQRKLSDLFLSSQCCLGETNSLISDKMENKLRNIRQSEKSCLYSASDDLPDLILLRISLLVSFNYPQKMHRRKYIFLHIQDTPMIYTNICCGFI